MTELQFEQDCFRALSGLVRRLGHDLAAPLSAVEIHLELANRHLGSRTPTEGPDAPALLERIRSAQRSMGTAGTILDVLRDAATLERGAPGEFSLPEALIRGASRAASGESRALLVLPEVSRRPTILGCQEWLESAFAAITSHALERRRGGPVTWTLETREGAQTLVCRCDHSEGTLDPGRLFDPAASGLLPARWAIESHGGTLTTTDAGGEMALVAAFPVEVR